MGPGLCAIHKFLGYVCRDAVLKIHDICIQDWNAIEPADVEAELCMHDVQAGGRDKLMCYRLSGPVSRPIRTNHDVVEES